MSYMRFGEAGCIEVCHSCGHITREQACPLCAAPVAS